MLRYVLLHHVMGHLEGVQGAWGYVQGGMGALADAIASSASAYGTSIFTEKVSASSPDYWPCCRTVWSWEDPLFS